ncbi:hypothetical protein [Pinibacter soli]|uniref:Uncharacterized protein n=1 Tax=Pinibacter soli TaxID=3044211 RepID=A0ABT6RDE2_9BACT|nr:hypothetical protein [Pinibacter soli]MDI3319889.1 hypothetical protein [Pinibacter soli]
MSEHLKNKLQQFEATPPKGLWDRIAVELDENRLYKDTSERLFNYETTPPAGIFDKVVTALERDLPQKETPVRKINTTFRWSVAAAILIALSTLGIFFLNNNKKDQSLATATKTNNLPPIHHQQITNHPPIVEADDNADDNADDGDNKSVKHLALNRILRSVHTTSIQNKNTETADVDFVSSKPTVQIVSSNIKASLSELASKFVVNGNYITVLGPNGELRKISMKIFNAMHAHTYTVASNSDNQNTVIENTAMEKKFSEWRTKIVQAGYAPNAFNGMDILNLKDLIREN